MNLEATRLRGRPRNRWQHELREEKTYLLTPWCRVLLEKLTSLQLVKKFSAFHGTRRFITALTSVRHMSLYWASPIQSIYPHPTSWRSIPILSTHLRLGLPIGSFPPVSPVRPYTPLSPQPNAPHAHPISFGRRRLVGGKGWKERIYNREEWKKLLRTARNRRILHMPME